MPPSPSILTEAEDHEQEATIHTRIMIVCDARQSHMVDTLLCIETQDHVQLKIIENLLA